MRAHSRRWRRGAVTKVNCAQTAAAPHGGSGPGGPRRQNRPAGAPARTSYYCRIRDALRRHAASPEHVLANLHCTQRRNQPPHAAGSASPFRTWCENPFPQICCGRCIELPQEVDPHGCALAAPPDGVKTSLSDQRCFHATRLASREFRKSMINNEALMGNQTRLLFATMRSPRFVRFLEKMSGIDGLVPDPAYEGSGIHITTRGGHLQVHSDFNHLGADLKWHRRLNIFVFLNHDWEDAYGGHLELWDRNLTRCAQRVLPTMNRFVAFSSTDFSYHGHPVPLAAPPGRMRRSVAMYYYTRSAPSRSASTSAATRLTRPSSSTHAVLCNRTRCSLVKEKTMFGGIQRPETARPERYVAPAWRLGPIKADAAACVCMLAAIARPQRRRPGSGARSGDGSGRLEKLPSFHAVAEPMFHQRRCGAHLTVPESTRTARLRQLVLHALSVF